MASVSFRSIELRLKRLERAGGAVGSAFLAKLSDDELDALIHATIAEGEALLEGASESEARQEAVDVIAEILGCSDGSAQKLLDASDAAHAADTGSEFKRMSNEELVAAIMKTFEEIKQLQDEDDDDSE